MPGIAGIINFRDGAGAGELLRHMLASMTHEQFYEVGTIIDTEIEIAAGWVSHGGSFAENVNTASAKTNRNLVFSGEIITPPMSPPVGATHGAAGMVDAICQGARDQQLDKLNGLFSGLVIDRPQRTAHLFNDRYSVERIYVSEHAGTVYFASEAKALLHVLPHLRSLDEQGLGEFLAYGCTFGNRTLFRGISLLPPAACWSFLPERKCQKSTYFTPKIWETQEPLTLREFETEFRETFPRILRNYLTRLDSLGISLTGGIDTRMIMACLGNLRTAPPCYTFSGQTEATLDAKLAAIVAEHCGLQHEVLRIGENFINEFPSLANRTVYISDGCCGVTGTHEIYLNAAARRLAPVRLTGNFGSEVLRSISTFKPSLLDPRLLADSAIRSTREACQARAEQVVHPVTFAAFQEIPWSLIGTLLTGRSQVAFRTPYLDNELVALAYRAPSVARTSSSSALRFLEEVNPPLASIPTDRGQIGTRRGATWVARRAYAEITFKLDYLHKEGLPSWLAPFDPALHALRHTGMLGLHKFLPYRRWFRSELAPYIRDVITDPRTRDLPFFNSNALEPILRAHVEGRKNHVREINAVLTLEAVNRLLLSTPAPTAAAEG